MLKKNIKPADKSLTPEHWTKVLAAAESEMKGLVLMAITTGQRIGDIIVLTHGDVDMRNGTIFFHLPKTRRVLEVPLDLGVRMWLEHQRQSIIPIEPATPLFPQLAARGAAKAALYLRKLGQKVGVDLASVSFRHTFVHRLMEQGTPREVIRRRLGYRSRR